MLSALRVLPEHRSATVDGDDRARDVAGPVRQQVGHDVGDLGPVQQPAEAHDLDRDAQLAQRLLDRRELRPLPAEHGDGRVAGRPPDLRDLRGLFSVVSQDAPLFDETVRENILLGRTDVPEARLREVVEAAHVADFLPMLPHGLDSPAGPRGSALSGGQRQRVAIARALLRDTPILLLDEATSALDTRSEAVVQAALDRLAAGRTTLVIAHRLSTVRRADRIVVLDRGRVVEEGRHDELVARRGTYAELDALQFRDREKAS